MMFALVVLVCYAWNTLVLAGTVYLVGFQEPAWSPWWFLLAVAVLSFPSQKKDGDE